MEPTISAQDLKARLWHGIDVTLVDVRRAAAREADPRLIPGAVWRDPEQVAAWARELPRDRPIVVYGVHGQEVSAGVVDRLRELGFDATLLEGGFENWRAAGGQLATAGERAAGGDRTDAARTDAQANEASEESFPASDPPSCTPVSGAGRPKRDPEQPG
jgi:rhodanese-related sulfurtransferase